jgi:CheY-like chemotaxis protein
MNGLPSVLVAEDDEADVFLLQRAFRKIELPNPVVVVADGLACIEKLTHAKAHPEERLPGLLMLDLKMPRRSGLQVLEWMRGEPVLRSIPVLIFSSSSNQSDIESAYDAGASGFMIKPPSAAERLDVAAFIKHWLRIIQPPLTASENFKAALRHRAAARQPELL